MKKPLRLSYKRMLSSVLSLTVAGACMFSASVHAESNGTFIYERDTWMLMNGLELVDKSYIEYLPDEYKTALRASLSNTEWESISSQLERKSSGFCYGFSVTSLLAVNDILNPEDLTKDDEYFYTGGRYSTDYWTAEERAYFEDRGNLCSYARSTTGDAPALLTYYQYMQYHDSVRQKAARQLYYQTDAERMQYLVKNVSPDSPAVICFGGYFYGRDYTVGHATLAYDVEYGEWEYEDTVYDGRVLVYDSNVPTKDTILERDLPYLSDYMQLYYMYFKTSDYSWYIPSYQVGSHNGEIDMVTTDVSLVNDGGFLNGTPEYTSDAQYIDVMTTNALESEGKVQRIDLTDDTWNIRSEETDDIMWVNEPIFIENYKDTQSNYYIPCENTGYLFTVEQSQELTVRQYYQNSMLSVHAGNADQTVFDPSGYVEFSGNDTDYIFDLTFNEGYYLQDWYNLNISGHADAASIQQTEEGYILSADSLKFVQISAKNDTHQAELTISTDADSVLIYEINADTLGAAIDTDRDGIYETNISDSTRNAELGDLDADGEINAADAAMVLVASANVGAGNESGLEQWQELVADVNNDGHVDASDAAWILVYAAEHGAGNNVSFSELVSHG